MKITEALPYCLGKYAVFGGRASRSEFWFYFLSVSLLYTVLILLASAISEFLGVLVYAILILGLLLPSLAVTVRRLHDSSKSGWWLLLGFVPFAGIVLLIFYLLPSDVGENAYGVIPE